MNIPPPAENTNIIPPLATRRLTAECELLAALLSPLLALHPDHRETAMADRAVLWERMSTRTAAYTWAEPAYRDILAAGARIVEQQQFPGASAVEAELRRVGAVDAAARIHDLSLVTPCDTNAEYHAGQCVELGRQCAVYFAAECVRTAMDTGQRLEDVAPRIAEMTAAVAEAKPTQRNILDLCHNAAAMVADLKPLAEPIIDGGLRPIRFT